MSETQLPPAANTPPTEPAPSDAPTSAPTPSKKRGARLGTWAIVLGVLGILFAVIPHTAGFGIFLAIVALLLGGLGILRKGRRALAGAVIGVVALILAIVLSTVHSGGSSSSDSTTVVPAAGSTSAAAPKAPAAPKQPAGTASELQALVAAKSYLISGIGFSQASLTDQLTSSAGNGFAAADAQWAVAHSGTDWNAQALTAAKAYLKTGPGFSQASLTDQLTSSAGNKFTAPEAAYGVAHSGADWNAQAVIAAKAYVKSGIGFSRQSLIEQLTSSAGNQFTAAQAAAGADAVGLK